MRSAASSSQSPRIRTILRTAGGPTRGTSKAVLETSCARGIRCYCNPDDSYVSRARRWSAENRSGFRAREAVGGGPRLCRATHRQLVDWFRDLLPVRKRDLSIHIRLCLPRAVG